MKKYRVTVNGTTYEVDVEQVGEIASQSAQAPKAVPVSVSQPVAQSAAPTQSGGSNITAPMPGTILKVNVHAGDTVKKGDVLCVLEAMKMENDITAPADMVISTVSVSQGASVATGDILVTYN